MKKEEELEILFHFYMWVNDVEYKSYEFYDRLSTCPGMITKKQKKPECFFCFKYFKKIKDYKKCPCFCFNPNKAFKKLEKLLQKEGYLPKKL